VTNINRLIIFCTLIFAVINTSCTTHYQVSTNLDKKNFQQYFSAGKVKIYNDEKEIKTQYKFKGAVEGQDCQQKAHHAIPSKINARTDARRKAFSLHANAVVFSGCVELNQEQLSQLNSNDTQQCHAITICYAKSYAMHELIK